MRMWLKVVVVYRFIIQLPNHDKLTISQLVNRVKKYQNKRKYVLYKTILSFFSYPQHGQENKAYITE